MSSLKKKLGYCCGFLGFRPRTFLSLKHIFRFFREYAEWKKQGGNVSSFYPILTDYNAPGGVFSGDYFHQDLLVAQKIFEANPRRHIDVGSRIDGFVAHVAAFRPIDVIDIRPLEASCRNITVFQADLMQDASGVLGKADSVSCLHALEHFGLGRYSDPISVRGHLAGLENLDSLVEDGGRLYIGVPISAVSRVEFNAHRTFNPKELASLETLSTKYKLLSFSYVDDSGDLFRDQGLTDIPDSLIYGCGIFVFKKTKKPLK